MGWTMKTSCTALVERATALTELVGSRFYCISDYTSEGSVSHNNGVWPDFLLTANLPPPGCGHFLYYKTALRMPFVKHEL